MEGSYGKGKGKGTGKGTGMGMGMGMGMGVDLYGACLWRFITRVQRGEGRRGARGESNCRSASTRCMAKRQISVAWVWWATGIMGDDGALWRWGGSGWSWGQDVDGTEAVDMGNLKWKNRRESQGPGDGGIGGTEWVGNWH